MSSIIEIAALCFLAVSGNSSFRSHETAEFEQQDCQNYYAKCFFNNLSEKSKLECIKSRPLKSVEQAKAFDEAMKRNSR